MTAVSIVMPAYNATAFIEEAITSALAQTMTDFELLVIDDASTDRTAEIVDRLGRKDSRVRLLRQAFNAGPSACRNLGFAHACGRWIAILDADDAFLPDRLERILSLGEREGADMVSDNLLFIPKSGSVTARPMIPRALLDAPRPLEMPEFIRRNVADRHYPGCNFGFLKPVLRRDFLRRTGISYDERVRFAEDFTFYVECLRAGARWWLMPEATYAYRVRDDSLTSVQTVHDLGRLRSVQDALLKAARDDRPLVGLIRRHKRVVDRCYHYRAFTDALKDRRYGTAASIFAGSPGSAALIVEESLRQLPTIAEKALRGGYRNNSAS